MEDNFGKYLRLFGSIFLLFIGTIVTISLLGFILKVVFGLVSIIPWITDIYTFLILLIPSVLFTGGFIIFVKRTAFHPNKVARFVSYSLFTLMLLAWAIVLVLDIIIFSKHAYTSVGKYYSYDIIFLFINVACFFGVGVLQALTIKKEGDWMDRKPPL